MKSKIIKTMMVISLSVSLILCFAACGGNYEESADREYKSGYVENEENDTLDFDTSNTLSLSECEVGEYIKFGAYEQDNNTSNGKEEIEWLILDIQGNEALVISKYALDCQRYNNKYETVTWETCPLREWLNNYFINSAFSSEEQAIIPTVTVSAEKNPEYGTDAGNTTQDKVFLLSITETKKYLTSRDARMCVPTVYAVEQGAYVSDSYSTGRTTCWWWLRTPGSDPDQTSAANVADDGTFFNVGKQVHASDRAVRPALWITLDS